MQGHQQIGTAIGGHMKRSHVMASKNVDPSERSITKIQAKRLADLTGLEPASFSGSLRELSEKWKWTIDPELFLFRKICGKVVKRDSVTGEEYPVPFATVYVEDTDCDLISYFPKGWQWGWHFPFNCRREVIAQTKTDKCGNFCVWIPRFDIDWVMRWRKARICFPLIFRRPSWRDLLPDIPELVDQRWPPIPQPDPGPLKSLVDLQPAIIEATGGALANRMIRKLRSEGSSTLGLRTKVLEERSLHARAFNAEMPPPLPTEFQDALAGQNRIAAKDVVPEEAIRTVIADKLGISVKEIADFNPRRFIGPFQRCVDIFLPDWQRIVDVPDISFRVGQDVDGDGTEETIYAESYFDVRWDETNIPDVTLVANARAKASAICNAPTVPCGNVPAILFAGFMPLTLPTYYDNTNGYAVRPNRPTTGTGRTPAQTPFCGNVQFYGCVDVQGAHYYRVLHSTNDGSSFAAVTGVAWNNYRSTGGAPIVIQADAAGWYAVHPVDGGGTTVSRSALEFPNLLMDWPTPTLGKQVLRLEIADATKTHIAFSPVIGVQTDNTAPDINVTRLGWKFAGEPDSALRNLLGMPCPTIRRGAAPQTIELVFSVAVSANHLRNARLDTSGCGGGAFTAVPDPSNHPDHWHGSVLDNTVLLYQRYRLDATALQGAYTFSCTATSRAMNPSGADGGNNVPPDWFYDPIYIYRAPSFGIAVVNVN